MHDDLVVEAPIGAVTPAEFQRLALEPVSWAEGLPLAGKARVAHCYLEEPEEPLRPQPDREDVIVETVLDTYLDDARTIVITAARADEDDLHRTTQRTKAKTTTPFSTISIRAARRSATSSRCR